MKYEGRALAWPSVSALQFACCARRSDNDQPWVQSWLPVWQSAVSRF